MKLAQAGVSCAPGTVCAARAFQRAAPRGQLCVPLREPCRDSFPHTWMHQKRVQRRLFPWRQLSHLHGAKSHDTVNAFGSNRPPRSRRTWSCEHQLQVKVNTNLLLSGEVENLRQRQLFIPVDPTILSLTETTTTTNRCALQTAGLLTLWQKKPRSACFCLCWLSRVDLTLCCSAVRFPSSVCSS